MIAKAKERNEKLAAGGITSPTVDPPSSKNDGEVKGNAANGTTKGKEKEVIEKMDVGTTPLKKTTRPPASSNKSNKSLRDPYADYTTSSLQQFPTLSTPTLLRNGSEPGISSVGPGRGNLAQSNGSKKQKQKQRQPEEPTRTFSPPPASTTASRASPSYTPASPNYSPPTPPPVSATPTSNQIEKQKQYPPRFPLPNQRKDLPPWMVVTSVNVEKKGWEAGVGKRVRGTSKEWSGWNVPPQGVVSPEQAEAEEQGQEGNAVEGWESWEAKEEAEARWEALKKLSKLEETKVGARVAIKVSPF
jgi:hypothetical protein